MSLKDKGAAHAANPAPDGRTGPLNHHSNRLEDWVKKPTSLVSFLRPYWHWAVLAPLLMILEVSMDLMQPTLMARVIDEGIAQRNMAVVINTGLLMVGVALAGAVGGVGCTITSVLASQGFGTDLRGATFRAVQALSFGNIDKLETGQLVTRLTNDVTQIQELVSMALRMMVRSPLLLVGGLAMAIITAPRLALMFVVLGPLVLGVLIWVISKAYRMFGDVQRRLDDVNTVTQENLAGVRVVKAFVRAERETARFAAANERLMDQTIHAIRTVTVSMPAVMLALNLGVVATVWFGGRFVIVGDMAVGQIVAFINYLGRTLMSIMFVSMLAMRVARAQASAERVREVLDSEPEVLDRPDAPQLAVPQGRLAFENVTFSYDGAEGGAVLKGIDFVADPGQTVAILGATGSGKTTLVNLIPRFYDVTEGRVTIDGVDVRDVDQQTLRRKIGVALQESVLFSGTIRDNIRYGQPDASDDEVVAAAVAAQAHEFIMGFLDGYDTVVGQRGVNLSGGQKQRIAIARAILVRPAILILDDSTSSVDVETETRIQEALEQVMRGRTNVVIAQRISTVLNADKILVLDDGQIAAQGTHRELMSSSRIYREIFESQLGNGGLAHGTA
ncbi:MAG: ABC transporter ATP-binding protein [Anaerolineales bacterium]|nr:ABC transporter ATP-binding protein [Anaerolineales bacterium]